MPHLFQFLVAVATAYAAAMRCQLADYVIAAGLGVVIGYLVRMMQEEKL